MPISSFLPIIDEHCDKIILGSMPGAESLRLQQYYAHPRNSFYRLLYALYDDRPSIDDYRGRVAFLLSKKIALWDVVSHCERQGSLDAKIQKPVPNGFAALISQYPNIRNFFFNGSKAYELFMKLVAPDLDLNGISIYKLPSSSPAHTLAFEQKLAAWRCVVSAQA